MIRVRQVVVRDPVGALDEDRFAVDLDDECRAVLVVAGVQTHRAQADAALPAVERLRCVVGGVGVGVGGMDAHLEVMEGVLAIADGPPQGRLVDGEHHHRGRRPRSDRRGAVDHVAAPGRRETRGEDERVVRILGTGVLDVDLDAHGGAAVVVLDGDERAHRREPRDPPPLKTRGAPDAGGLQVRSPVPAEAAGHLAHHVQRVRILQRSRADPIRLGLAVLQGRREVDRERHPTPAAASQHLAHVEAVGAMLVGGATQHPAIERDRRDRVQPLEDEVDSLARDSRVDLDLA